MASDLARQSAAQAWCSAATSTIVIDPVLAEAFADILDAEWAKAGGDSNEVEKLRVQLALCSVAALGGTKDPSKRGDYVWSQAYQDVLDLRIRFDKVKSLVDKFVIEASRKGG